MSKPHRLTKLRVDEVSVVDQAANGKRFLVLKRAGGPTRIDGGEEYTAADYAYTPQPDKPSTWKLRLAEYVDGEKRMTAAQVGRAVAALSAGGYRGRRVDIPAEDLRAVKEKLRGAWKKTHPDAEAQDMPEHIRKAEQTGIGDWLRDAIRKAAGIPGQTDGGAEMTAEEIKKAVQEAAEAALAPIVARIDKVEAALAPGDGAGVAGEGEPVEKTEDPAAEALTADVVAKVVSDAVSAQIAPLAQRLEVVESAAGVRKSSTPEGAHQVRKADGSYSWAGSGLLL
ncbi:MAG: hypothetical protein M1325_04380 [Actinobacteria bacterium]|nr:hypothetical protein [Actinomycetota bacterium]